MQLAGFPVNASRANWGVAWSNGPHTLNIAERVGSLTRSPTSPSTPRPSKTKTAASSGEENAVPPTTGLTEFVRCALGDDLSRSLAGAWPELGDHGHTLIHVSVRHVDGSFRLRRGSRGELKLRGAAVL
jgi:hypothetical protein